MAGDRMAVHESGRSGIAEGDATSARGWRVLVWTLPGVTQGDVS